MEGASLNRIGAPLSLTRSARQAPLHRLHPAGVAAAHHHAELGAGLVKRMLQKCSQLFPVEHEGGGLGPGPRFVLGHPDADQIAREIVTLRQRMQSLACNVFLSDLTLEFDAVRCGAWPWLPSLESPAAPVNSQPTTCPPSGAHSTLGVSEIVAALLGIHLSRRKRFHVQAQYTYNVPSNQ